MSVIDKYLAAYELQLDYWQAVSSRAQTMIEAELVSSGLRAIATSRAKSVERLRVKLQQRDRDRHYATTEEIADDIVDLAGVRIALYFPGQMAEVEQLIRGTFDVRGDVKHFPGAGERPGSPRFSGYGARHFRVHIREQSLPDAERRFASAPIEIQVASVLMHAWSEVEHDLVYKPLEGTLSEAEYALLDQLNGLVLAGEIALEQLQAAGDKRVTQLENPFSNHYELAEYLRTKRSGLARVSDSALGAVDVLYEFLAEEDRARASDIDPYLQDLDDDFENRPVAEQLADRMLTGDPAQYTAYRKATAAARHPSRRQGARLNDVETARAVSIQRFLNAWVEFEQWLALVLPDEERRPTSTKLRAALKHQLIDQAQYQLLQDALAVRNTLVHRGPNNLGQSPAQVGYLTEFVERTLLELRKRT